MDWIEGLNHITTPQISIKLTTTI